MDCDKCEDIAESGGKKVCGFLLAGGETVFIHNGKITDPPCPKVIWERYYLLSEREKGKRTLKIVNTVWEKYLAKKILERKEHE